MLAAQIQPDYSIGLNPVSDPILPEGGALIQVSVCGLCGSDLDKYIHRKSPPGSVLGHEVVGRIIALSEGHGTNFRVGDRIVTAHHVPCLTCHYCLNGSQSMCRQFKATNITPGGFAQQIAVSRDHLHQTAFLIPDEITDAEASCIEPLACVLQAIYRAGSQQNGSVAIIGLGFIGLLASQVYRAQGFFTLGLDISPDRLALAKSQQWADQALDPASSTQEAINEVLAQHTPLGKMDQVFLTVVTEKTLQQALALVRDGGTIVLFASPQQGQPVIHPAPLYFREINLITSYSPSLEALQEAAQTVFQRKIQVAPLITHTLPLAQINEALTLYQSGAALKVLLQP